MSRIRETVECYHNKWHPSEPQCQDHGSPPLRSLGNFTDSWTWCHKHQPQQKLAALDRGPQEEQPHA